MRLSDLMPVITATWPAAAHHENGPFTLPQVIDGGQRVSAARLHDPLAQDATEAEIDAAIAGLAALGQPPLFMLLDHQGALDARLAARGFVLRDATCAMIVSSAQIAAPPPPSHAFPSGPPWPSNPRFGPQAGLGRGGSRS